MNHSSKKQLLFPIGMMDFIGLSSVVIAMMMVAIPIVQCLFPLSEGEWLPLALFGLFGLPLFFLPSLLWMSFVLNRSLYRFYVRGQTIDRDDRRDVRRHFEGVLSPFHRRLFRLRKVDMNDVLNATCPPATEAADRRS